MICGWKHPAPAGWEVVVEAALDEDIGPGDLSACCFERTDRINWYIEAQGKGVVCGVGLAASLFEDAACHIWDGDPVEPKTRVLSGNGFAHEVLSRERTALNFIMGLSGVATMTQWFVKATAATNCRIVDTRKTIPGLRALQKYAVRCGGGSNHRQGLYDAVMIKDNHIRACGSITKAVDRVRSHVGHTVKIEVECETRAMVKEAIEARADIVMLDNMAPDMMKSIIESHKGHALFEASGGITLQTVNAVASTGVDIISVGAITHSAPALSFHLEVE